MAGPDTGADVTFRFGQVDVETPVVEFMGTCGNMSSAIGPFAVDEGLVEAVEPITTVRVLSVNTGQIYLCHVPVKDGRAEVEGDYSIDGVPGPAARIALEFLEPGGSLGKGLLPTGKVRETITLADGRTFEVSLVDAANPLIFVRAADLGSDATERPEEVDANKPLHAALEEIRDHRRRPARAGARCRHGLRQREGPPEGDDGRAAGARTAPPAASISRPSAST